MIRCERSIGSSRSESGDAAVAARITLVGIETSGSGVQRCVTRGGVEEMSRGNELVSMVSYESGDARIMRVIG